MFSRTHQVAIVLVAAALLLIGGAVVFVETRGHTAPALTNTQTEVVSAAQIAQKYQVGIRAAAAELEPLLNRKLVAADQAALAALRDELVALKVPPQAQSFHLQLVLKVSLLNELLGPGKVTAAARGVPTVAGTQGELKTLLATSATYTR
jgi:hypothetical protein